MFVGKIRKVVPLKEWKNVIVQSQKIYFKTQLKIIEAKTTKSPKLEFYAQKFRVKVADKRAEL